MPKLHLKRTPEEEAQRQLRKEQRRAKRKRKYAHSYDFEGPSTSHPQKRYHLDRDMSEEHSHRKWASSDEDEEQYGPQPAAESAFDADKYKEEYAAKLEEQRFREKMFDALGDDEHLDSVEAHLNDFAHVPDRWRTEQTKRRTMPDEYDELAKLNPQEMDDAEYAEWIRLGMYRKTHAKEYAEMQEQKAARKARQADAKARKEEAKRLERQALEEDMAKRHQRESHKMEYARQEYHIRWKALLELNGSDVEAILHFDDIPWPIVAAHRQRPEKKKRRDNHPDPSKDTPVITTVEDMTTEAISAFILPLVSADTSGEKDEEKAKKARKEKLRETFLRFHPDKFEGRFMHRVKEGDKEKVREGIGQVSRVLNSLLGKEA